MTSHLCQQAKWLDWLEERSIVGALFPYGCQRSGKGNKLFRKTGTGHRKRRLRKKLLYSCGYILYEVAFDL